jgi:UTP--glucose-1-phosphate uridylyltransferase
MAISTADFKNGMCIEYNGKLWTIVEFQHVKPGKGGEIQLTDAMYNYMKDKGMMAVKMKGRRFDAGDWVDYLTAGVYFGMKDESLAPTLRESLKELLDK